MVKKRKTKLTTTCFNNGNVRSVFRMAKLYILKFFYICEAWCSFNSDNIKKKWFSLFCKKTNSNFHYRDMMDWSNYDDNLDNNHQRSEIWNQF